MASQVSQAGPVDQVGQALDTLEVEARDILTTFPSEILLKIVSEVPTKNFLDLVQTCRMLRNFVKINANRICNEAIRSRFPLESKVLQSEVVSGWLVPTHKRVVQEEDRYNFNRLYEISRGMAKVDRNGTRHLSLVGDTLQQEKLAIKVTEPGPQYLHFLESPGLCMVTPERPSPSPRNPPHPVDEVVVDGKSYFLVIITTAYGDYMKRRFWNFMKRFNQMRLLIKKGEFRPPEHPRPSTRFPREMVWFYGVERLRIVKTRMVANVSGIRVEEEDNEDWKSLPMLLWE